MLAGPLTPIVLASLLVALFDAAAPTLRAQDPPAPPTLQAGDLVWQWQSFGLRPDGTPPGSTHGNLAVDPDGRIWFSTDTERALNVFDRSGTQLDVLGPQFANGTHGMTIARDGSGEPVLWITHLGRHEVARLTMDGSVTAILDWPKDAGIYTKKEEYRPTDLAVAPNGSIYVADGYGKSFVHQFDSELRYVRSFGGHGTEPGRMRTPHGITLDTRGKEPRLIVADRENGRLQIFDLEGGLRSIVSGIFRRPCDTTIHPDGKHLAVADLAGRVTILDERNELVAHLGDQPEVSRRATNQVAPEHWQDGVFLSPHGAVFDSHGDLYVMDWNVTGRLTRLVAVVRKEGGK
ncbi:MAG: hypothetical protein AB7I19_04870 [Planctomycetota bacterium]